MGMSNLELGCQIFWGETIDPDDCNLTSTFKDPETEYMEKESFMKKYNSLSKEAKEVIRIIFTLPEVSFNKNGVLITEVISRAKTLHNWTPYWTKKYIAEVGRKFGAANAR